MAEYIVKKTTGDRDSLPPVVLILESLPARLFDRGFHGRKAKREGTDDFDRGSTQGRRSKLPLFGSSHRGVLQQRMTAQRVGGFNRTIESNRHLNNYDTCNVCCP